MANWEHVKVVRQGAAAIRAWREKNHDVRFDLNLADLSGIDLEAADLNGADLRMADLHGANLKSANLFKANVNEANLTGANLCMADLRRINFAAANLTEANLTGADLTKAVLTRARLTNANLLGANLLEADLSRAALAEANLAVAALRSANLIEADLSRANLIGADLSLANLAKADFGWADLSNTQLTGADLTGTILLGANLTGVNLTGANLATAICGCTVFAGIDLSDAKGLDTVRHLMPSTLGVDTVFKSRGKLPEAFLRGAGVPKVLAEILPELMAQPVVFDTCFVCFVEGDGLFAERLYNDLLAEGVRCWRWKVDARWPGRRMGELDEALHTYDKMVMVCSEKTLNSSSALHEIERALQKEDQAKAIGRLSQAFFPIAIDDYIFKDWNHRMRDYVMARSVVDCRNTEDAEWYKGALKQLIHDLREEPAVNASAFEKV